MHLLTYNECMLIKESVTHYIEGVQLSRSKNTARTYSNGLNFYLDVLRSHKLDPEKSDISSISENSILWMCEALKELAPSTERLYLTATVNYFEHLLAENLAQLNMLRVQKLVKMNARRSGIRLPQFERKAIEDVILYAAQLDLAQHETDEEYLRNLRDRAFLITLADTGLRVHEACGLRRSQIDWIEGRAVITGKGDKQAVVRFSSRALRTLKEYIAARSKLDGSSGRALTSLPLFARHDRGAGRLIKPITTATGRNIVNQRVAEAIGDDKVGLITPHSFRHFFVTTVLRASGNLKMAQELARHTNIAVTQRYAHLSDDELDKGYHEIFES